MKYTIEEIDALSEEEIIFRLHNIDENTVKLIKRLKILTNHSEISKPLIN